MEHGLAPRRSASAWDDSVKHFGRSPPSSEQAEVLRTGMRDLAGLRPPGHARGRFSSFHAEEATVLALCHGQPQRFRWQGDAFEGPSASPMVTGKPGLETRSRLLFRRRDETTASGFIAKGHRKSAALVRARIRGCQNCYAEPRSPPISLLRGASHHRWSPRPGYWLPPSALPIATACRHRARP